MQDGLIHRDEFALALFKTQGQSNLFTDKVFQVFDIKRNDVIDFDEFVRSLSVFHPTAPLSEKAHCAPVAQPEGTAALLVSMVFCVPFSWSAACMNTHG